MVKVAIITIDKIILQLLPSTDLINSIIAIQTQNNRTQKA